MQPIYTFLSEGRWKNREKTKNVTYIVRIDIDKIRYIIYNVNCKIAVLSKKQKINIAKKQKKIKKC